VLFEHQCSTGGESSGIAGGRTPESGTIDCVLLMSGGDIGRQMQASVLEAGLTNKSCTTLHLYRSGRHAYAHA
jgi:hypothetical protein